MSYSYTTTETFTLTHARRLAAKAAADMRQCLRLYGKPEESSIAEYQEELTVLIHDGYVASYEFGFKSKGGRRVVSWLYTIGPSGDLEGGRSGGLFPAADVANASMFNFLSYSSAWASLSATQKAAVQDKYTIRRSDGTAPTDGEGYWEQSRTYTSGGVAVVRREFRPW